MSKNTRTILFLILAALFLLTAPGVVFYSQGYRFDFESKRITQTGGLYLKIFPKTAQIFLDEKLRKESSFWTGSLLTKNLLPKTHQVEVEKEGYHPWQKSLEIKEKQVTEAKNIILFPQNPKFEVLAEGVENFWFSPDGKKIVIYELEKDSWALKLYDLEKNIKSHLIQAKDIYPGKAVLLSLEFSPDSKEIYLNVGMQEKERNFVLALDKFTPVLAEKKDSPPPKGVIAFQSFNNTVYYLDGFGYVFKAGASFESGLKINEKPFPVQPETEYKLKVFQEYIFLQERQTLYLLDPNSKSFEKFFEGIAGLKISPDLKKLTFFSDSEIWILFLKDRLEQPAKKAGTKIFLTRLSEKINGVFWLNSDYLIFNSGRKIKITEIDERDKINIIDLAEFDNPPKDSAEAEPTGQAKIFWNPTDKKLYVLVGENLLFSEKLLP